MNICFISSSFARNANDVCAPWILRLSQELIARGWRVSVFVPAHKGLAQTECAGARIHRFRYSLKSWERLTHEDRSPALLHTFGHRLLLLSYMVCGSFSAFFFFLRNRFDVIDVHWPFPQAVFGIIGKKLTGARLTYYFYASEILLIENSPLLKRFCAWLMTFADEILTISNPSKELIERNFGGGFAIKVIPFGTTLPSAAPTPSGQPRSGEPLKLLFAGKLIERKGVTYLVRAVRLLKDCGADVRLKLVGNGYLKDSLKAEISDLGLENEVYMAGFLPSQSRELSDAYAGCDIFILPSIIDSRGDTEGLGYVVLDAMAHGKPVIASAVGGITDMIKDGETGYLVPQKDPAALAEKIIFVRDHYAEAQRIAAQGWDHAVKNFTWEKAVEGLSAAYKGGA